MKAKSQKSRPKADQPLAEKAKSQKEGSSKSSAKKESFPSKTKSEPQSMEELLAGSPALVVGLKKGDTVEGTVFSVSGKEILVDIGKKSFGIVAEWELEQVREYASTLKVGDKIVAHVMNPENDFGFVVLSLRRASFERRWTLLTQAKEIGSDIEVSILELAKGGLLVDWQGLRGFIPSTQLETNLSSNPGSLIGRRIKVKVLEVDKSVNRLVLSQKAAALGVTPSVQKQKLDKIKTGDSLKVIVSGVASFGVFVDIEGIEGLVHISEIGWEKVENPEVLFKVGDKVEVLVLDVNKHEGKLNLSIKRLTPDPWKNILDRYPLESNVKGKVVRTVPYGVFVQLEPGVEGLIHISKITATEAPKVGDELECMVENIDPVKRKMSLSFLPKVKPVGYR